MRILQRLREQFWFIPAVLCLAAFLVAEALVLLDEQLGDVSLPDWLSYFLYRVGESGSRDILSAIATSSLAVAGTTFSITMAVLALTSSTYGPRLVRNFMTDRGNQTVLGVYVATFLYSLVVLRSIRVLGDPGSQDADVFVPHLAVNVAVLFAIANVGVLVYFIHHISDSIQVATLASRVRTELLETVERLYPADVGHDVEDEPTRQRDVLVAEETPGVAVAAGCPGYVKFIDEDKLLDAARAHDVVVVLRVRPGEYVVHDTVMASAHPSENVSEGLQAAVRDACEVADARTPHQDVEFAIQQLTEMAVRALSPSANDPYTAVNALNDLSAGLSVLASRDVPSPARYDAEGGLRIVAPRPELADVVDPVIDAMRWYAPSSPAVMHATLELLRRTGEHATSRALQLHLAARVDLVRDAFESSGHSAHDLAEFEEHADRVLRALLTA